MNKKSLFEATTSHTPCAVTHQKQIHSGENIIHNPVYEANEEEWNQEFFEHLGIPNLSEERIKQGDAYVREVVERFKLAQLPYFLSLLVQLRGDVPPSSSDPNPEAPLTNVQVTDKDFLVITQCPLITEGWKNKYNDHYFPSSKDEPVAYKWVTLLIIGPFLHLSTAKIFLRAWLNNAQGLPTKVGKCLPLVNAMNTYFSQKEVVVRAPPEEGTSQPRVTIEVHVTPIPLEENFKQKDLPLPHFRWKEIEDEYLKRTNELSETFPTLTQDLSTFLPADTLVWNKWSVEIIDSSMSVTPLGKYMTTLKDFIQEGGSQ